MHLQSIALSVDETRVIVGFYDNWALATLDVQTGIILYSAQSV